MSDGLSVACPPFLIPFVQWSRYKASLWILPQVGRSGRVFTYSQDIRLVHGWGRGGTGWSISKVLIAIHSMDLMNHHFLSLSFNDLVEVDEIAGPVLVLSTQGEVTPDSVSSSRTIQHSLTKPNPICRLIKYISKAACPWLGHLVINLFYSFRLHESRYMEHSSSSIG